jgi:nicotinamidase-related amidase
MRAPLSLDPRRTALLLIDLQEEQRQHPLYSVAGFDHVLGNARSLLQSARHRGLRIIHAAYRRDFASCPPRPFEPLADDGSPAFSDAANPLTAICNEVRPIEPERVIYKNDASAFSGGALKESLSDHRIEWLIMTGVWTEACVAATIRDAIASAFHVLLVKDACGSGTESMHQTAVLNIANRLDGGAVTETQGAVKLIEGEEIDVWVADRPVPLLFNYSDAARHYWNL